jgi:hypothetical protein
MAVAEHGGFLYLFCDSYTDDPRFGGVGGEPHLVVPYASDTNHIQFLTSRGFNTATHFSDNYRLALFRGVLSSATPSIGFHSRMTGRPGATHRTHHWSRR